MRECELDSFCKWPLANWCLFLSGWFALVMWFSGYPFFSPCTCSFEGYASKGIRPASIEGRCDPCTVGEMAMQSTCRLLGHLLLRSFVRSHRSLIRLLRTARFARALRRAHSLARSLTHSRAHGKEVSVYGINASISCSFNPLCGGSEGAGGGKNGGNR